MDNKPMFDFNSFQELLIKWPDSFSQENYSRKDPILGRILKIIQSNKIDNSLADLLPLIRQLLFKKEDLTNNHQLVVPMTSGFPNKTTWEEYGFNVVNSEKGYIIEPKPWQPQWLDEYNNNGNDVFQAEFKAVKVRQDSEVPMDRFLINSCGYDTYTCPGQREAVRSLLFMPEGETLIVNLPTGSGKTSVAQAPVLLRGLDNGLTIFVVPTTALVIDLSRRMSELLSLKYSQNKIPAMAWYGDCDEETKKNIKEKIRNGSQGILFTSPESVTGVLLPSLYYAAKKGALKYFIVDEAHLIAQWGDSFRPAFQKLSGIRRGLLRQCKGEKFRTVLLSATFSKQTLDTLHVLFSPKAQIQMVSAVHLRPEPRYFSYKVNTWEEKRTKILELIKHVPRPFILYVTERKHADSWYKILINKGNSRIDKFHGDTKGNKRKQIIESWVNDELDGIIATSAFGVGMDKSDVRTIIHATMPETLDRYYQEVGRGGRDGKASLSITIYDKKDEQTAYRMSQSSLISEDKAYQRWITMYRASEHLENDMHLLDLSIVPPDLKQQSDFNNQWNMRTLILLARAGLIELNSLEPEKIEQQPDENNFDFEYRTEQYWDEFYNKVPVRTLSPYHLKWELFEAQVITERQKGDRLSESSFRNLKLTLQKEKKISTTLSELYSSHEPGQSILVSSVCRGCKVTDTMDGDPYNVSYQIPSGIGIEKIRSPQISIWEKYFPWLDGVPVVILCPKDDCTLTGKLLRALEVLVSMYGIKEISASYESWMTSDNLKNLYKLSPDQMLISRFIEEDINLPEYSLPLPRISILFLWENKPIPEYLLYLERPLHVIFAAEDIPSLHPLRIYQEDATNHIQLDEFLRISTQ